MTTPLPTPEQLSNENRAYWMMCKVAAEIDLEIAMEALAALEARP